MRILHVNNQAGIAVALAKEQRALGHEAVVLAPFVDSRRYGLEELPDVDLATRHGAAYPASWTAFMLRRLAWLNGFDVIHLHAGVRLWQLLYRLVRPPLVFHFHGTDVRQGFGAHQMRRAAAILYSTPDLKPLLPPEAEWFPAPVAIDAAALEEPRTWSPVLRVLHAPSNPHMKGTSIVHEAMRRLAPDLVAADHYATDWEGPGLRYRYVQGMPKPALLRELRRTDLLVDQITPALGAYGLVSVEAMLLGAVPACSVNPCLYPDLPPVVLAWSERTLRNAVYRLACQEDGALDGLRDQGPAYAREFHDPRTLAQRSLAIYERALEGRRKAS